MTNRSSALVIVQLLHFLHYSGRPAKLGLVSCFVFGLLFAVRLSLQPDARMHRIRPASFTTNTAVFPSSASLSSPVSRSPFPGFVSSHRPSVPLPESLHAEISRQSQDAAIIVCIFSYSKTSTADAVAVCKPNRLPSQHAEVSTRLLARRLRLALQFGSRAWCRIVSCWLFCVPPSALVCCMFVCSTSIANHCMNA